MDDIISKFRLIKVIFHENIINIPVYLFNESKFLSKYFEEYDSIDFSEYDINVIKYYLKLLLHIDIYNYFFYINMMKMLNFKIFMTHIMIYLLNMKHMIIFLK